MPDNMYEHWARWSKEAEDEEAKWKLAREKAKKDMEHEGIEPPDPDDEGFEPYPRQLYEKFIMRGTLPVPTLFFFRSTCSISPFRLGAKRVRYRRS